MMDIRLFFVRNRIGELGEEMIIQVGGTYGGCSTTCLIDGTRIYRTSNITDEVCDIIGLALRDIPLNPEHL